MKRILLILLVALLLCGCTAGPVETTVATTTAPTVQTEPPTTVAEGDLVGICLPDETVRRWVSEAADMETALTELGYRVEILYAGGDAAQQAQQMKTLIDQGAKCLIVAAVDPAELLAAGEKATNAGIPVVAYDRLLTDTEAVSAFVGFDYAAIGREMGEYIVKTKQLDQAEEGTVYTVELFMGSPEDHNALQMYLGLMEQLQPYLDSGVLTALSGRTAFEDCCIVGWDSREAGGRLARYLAEEYQKAPPDILCTATDGMAAGCIEALKALEKAPEAMPLITGTGGTLAEGQAVTFPVETRALAEPAAMIADQLISGLDLTVTDPEGCHNNAIFVPAYYVETELTKNTA